MKATIKIQTNRSYSSESEIRAAIESALEYQTVVSVNNVADYEPESEECIFAHNLSVWDEEHQGEVIYFVTIYAYCVGHPDFDYIYSYSIE